MSTTCHSLKERRCKSWAWDSPQAEQAESVALSRGELLGMSHPVGPTAQDGRDPLRGAIRTVGRAPSQLARAHSALCSGPAFSSHTLFLCFPTAASLAIFSVHKTQLLFYLKPTTGFLPLIPKQPFFLSSACSFHTTLSFTHKPQQHQLPSDPGTMGVST